MGKSYLANGANLTVLLVLLLTHFRTAVCAPADEFKSQLGTPVSVEVKLRRETLKGTLGASLPKDAVGSPCASKDGGECWEWKKERQQLMIQNEARSTGSNRCKTVVWLSQDVNKAPENCWALKGRRWYGGGSADNQKWPISTDSLRETPQVTGGSSIDKEDVNNIHNRLWFSTEGVAIKVEDNVPLFVTVEGGELCFKAENKYPYVLDKTVPPTLSYAICYGQDLTELHHTVMALYFKIPQDVPTPSDLMSSPIWSTYPKFPMVTNVKYIRDYVDHIENSVGSVASVLLLGHGWTSCTGEHVFNTAVMGDPRAFINYIKLKGMHLGLWVHPYVAFKNCQAFDEGVRYFVQQPVTKNGPASITYKGELVATVDFTNPESVEWYSKSLKNLQDTYGVEAFFFDRGQSAFLPRNAAPLNAPLELQPDIYSIKYVEMAAALSSMSIVNIGRNTQQHPLLVRMPRKNGDSWTDNGIQSVIPSALQMGINGFPFILPDVVGGSIYKDRPDRKLYIRWVQLTALMPALHFSLGPWEYNDTEVLQITSDMITLRDTLWERYIYPAAESVHIDGSPMIRPVWWIATDDEQAYDVDDQFLVGDSLLVAPVVDEREVRDIYFPPGIWKSSIIENEVIKGPTKKLNYRVPLDKLAYFTADHV